MSAYDLSKFLPMFINNGFPFLHSSSIMEMKKVVVDGHIPPYNPNPTNNSSSFPLAIQFGLIRNWRIMNDSRKFIGQRGTNLGATHTIMVNEDNTIGVIILSNGDMTLENELSARVYNTLTDIQMILFDYFEHKIKNSANMSKTISSMQLFLICIMIFFNYQ
jgi:CubicO group peptidase (beta-lactamase class C family)